MRKFAEGGFSAAQEEWLGGADRTDPYILARMRSAVPDEPAPKSRDFDAIDADMVAPSRNLTSPVTKTVSKTKVSVTKPKSDWDDNSSMLPGHTKPENKTVEAEKTSTRKPYIDIPSRSNIGLRQFKNIKDDGSVKKMSSGGKVKSASSRADGCAIRGKTRA